MVDALRSAADGGLDAEILSAPTRQPLTEWARQHQVNTRTARDRAEKGHLQTARKEGPVWTIDTTEPPIRKGKHHHGKHDHQGRPARLPHR